MKNPILKLPSIEYKDSYLEALEENKQVEQTRDTRLAMPAEGQSFEAFVKEQAEVKPHVKFHVPATTLWMVDGDEFIGRLSIRHELNDELRKIGGHIGYWIRPSKRRMGYGKKILELGLTKAKELGIKNALITCDVDNIASRKIIEAHGGKLQKTVELEGKKSKLHHFRLDLE